MTTDAPTNPMGLPLDRRLDGVRAAAGERYSVQVGRELLAVVDALHAVRLAGRAEGYQLPVVMASITEWGREVQSVGALVSLLAAHPEQGVETTLRAFLRSRGDTFAVQRKYEPPEELPMPRTAGFFKRAGARPMLRAAEAFPDSAPAQRIGKRDGHLSRRREPPRPFSEGVYAFVQKHSRPPNLREEKGRPFGFGFAPASGAGSAFGVSQRSLSPPQARKFGRVRY